MVNPGDIAGDTEVIAVFLSLVQEERGGGDHSAGPGTGPDGGGGGHRTLVTVHWALRQYEPHGIQVEWSHVETAGGQACLP